MWLGLYHPWTLVLKWSWKFCLSDVVRIASSLDLCPKVRGIDHLVIGSCVLQVMLLQMMLLLIKISSVVVDDWVVECCRRWRSKMKTWCCRRCSNTEDIEYVPIANVVEEKFQWFIDVSPWCCWWRSLSLPLQLMSLMLSLLAPIVDVVVVYIIPFSLRGSVEMLYLQRIFYCILLL